MTPREFVNRLHGETRRMEDDDMRAAIIAAAAYNSNPWNKKKLKPQDIIKREVRDTREAMIVDPSAARAELAAIRKELGVRG